MSLKVQEGFDIYGYDSPWWNSNSVLDSRMYVGSGVTLDVTQGRRSTPCVKVPGSANGVQGGSYWAIRLPSDLADGTFGVAIKPEYFATASTEMIRIRSAAGGTQFCLDITNLGRLRVKTAYNGSVLAESADGAITFGIFQYLEVQFTCDGTDSIQAWVNGVEVIALTGSLNLRQSGAGGFGQIQLGPYESSLTFSTYYDDLYILDSSGSAPFNDRLGDQKMDGHLFTADGSLTDWTSNKASHYDAINDRGSGYNTYYNESDAVAECDSYTITPGDMVTIKAVTIRAYCRNPGGGTAKFKPFVKISGTKYYGDEVQLPADTCDLREYTWYQNPAISGAWTKSALQSTEFGWETTVLS